MARDATTPRTEGVYLQWQLFSQAVPSASAEEDVDVVLHKVAEDLATLHACRVPLAWLARSDGTQLLQRRLVQLSRIGGRMAAPPRRFAGLFDADAVHTSWRRCSTLAQQCGLRNRAVTMLEPLERVAVVVSRSRFHAVLSSYCAMTLDAPIRSPPTLLVRRAEHLRAASAATASAIAVGEAETMTVLIKSDVACGHRASHAMSVCRLGRTAWQLVAAYATAADEEEDCWASNDADAETTAPANKDEDHDVTLFPRILQAAVLTPTTSATHVPMVFKLYVVGRHGLFMKPMLADGVLGRALMVNGRDGGVAEQTTSVEPPSSGSHWTRDESLSGLWEPAPRANSDVAVPGDHNDDSGGSFAFPSSSFQSSHILTPAATYHNGDMRTGPDVFEVLEDGTTLPLDATGAHSPCRSRSVAVPVGLGKQLFQAACHVRRALGLDLVGIDIIVGRCVMPWEGSREKDAGRIIAGGDDLVDHLYVVDVNYLPSYSHVPVGVLAARLSSWVHERVASSPDVGDPSAGYQVGGF